MSDLQIQAGLHSIYRPWPLLIFGVVQVLCGAGLIFSDLILFSFSPIGQALMYSMSGSGLLLGVFYIIAGSFGIAAGRPLPAGLSPHFRKSLLITSLVMSILSFIASVGLIIMFALLLFVFSAVELRINHHRCHDPNYDHYEWCSGYGFLIANFICHTVAFVVSVGESITAGISLCRLPRHPVRTYVLPMQPVYTGLYTPVPAVACQYAQPQWIVTPVQQGSVAPQYGRNANAPPSPTHAAAKLQGI